MKKTAIMLLCLALLLSAASAGCGRDGEAGHEYDTAADFRPDEGEVFSDVPAGSFGGYTFRVLRAKTGRSSAVIDSESMTGAALSDAVYKRNRNVEARLDVKIEEISDTPETVFQIACDSVRAGEDAYSAVWNSASYMGAMAASGYLISSDYLTQLDLEKPWWNSDVISEVAVGERSYLFFGDAELSLYDAHSMVGVNMELLASLNVEKSPFEMYADGEWTLDNMISLARLAAADTDGDGEMTSADTFGIALDGSAVMPLIIGGGAALSAKDELDLPYLSCIDDEHFFDVYTLVADKVFSGGRYVFNADRQTASEASALAQFKGEGALFFITDVGSLEYLRDMECEFGILPVPKINVGQKSYAAFVSGASVSALGVPSSGRNFKRTGIILENLAAESYRQGGVRETYVDSVLAFRYVDDAVSRANLFEIFTTGTFDLAELYGWGSLADEVAALCSESADNLSSALNVFGHAASDDMLAYIDEVQRNG